MSEWKEWLLNSCPECDRPEKKVPLHVNKGTDGVVCSCGKCGGEWTGLKYRLTPSKAPDTHKVNG